MENRIKRIFLNSSISGLVMVGLAASAMAEEASQSEESGGQAAEERPLIEPDIQPRRVYEDLIDTENFEVGFNVGVLNIEDFGSPMMFALRGAYHLNEYLFVEANAGVADGEETSFEKLTGNSLISDDERTYAFYNLALGYNILPGEAYFGSDYAFNTNFYLVGGMGATNFAGDSRLTTTLGAGYQVLLTDWLSLRVDMRQHIFEIDVTGEAKNTVNTQFTGGLSLFF